MHKDKAYVKRILILAICIGFSDAVFASGFYLPTSNSADLGEANAGGAALAQDASTIYTNPAGLIRLKQQLVISAIGITNPVKFTGTATSPGFGAGGSFSQTGDASSNASSLLPAIYYALPLSDKFIFGLSVTAPYGLGSDYPDNSMVRYDVTYTQIMSSDISPNIAYKLTDKLSIGVGFDALYLKAHQKIMLRTQPLTPVDSRALYDTSGWGYGWHGGLLYQFTPQTRVGLSYRSKIVDQLKGHSKLYINGGVYNGVNSSDNLQTAINLPPIATLSAYHDLTPQWAIMGTVEYYEWSVFKNQHIYNAASVVGTTDFNIPQNFHDSWRYALGTSYKLNDKWLLRTGAEYDQTPISDTYRDLTMPGADRYGISVGAHYQATKNIGIDAAYYHAFFENVRINNTSNISNNSLVGTSKSFADALGIQIDFNIA